MDPDSVIEVLKGHKFTFSLDNMKQYVVDTRRIAEKILKRSKVNIENGSGMIESHLVEMHEPQYRTIFIMRLLQVAIEQVKSREVADLLRNVFEDGIITK